MPTPDHENTGPIELQRRLIAALKNPALHDHPSAGVTVIETHISFVLLTGPLAYKVKKAVDLGFVDYSSLARRKFFCEEELRLNRRLAPELYLGVVPVSGSADRPLLDDGSSPIEYAVKMLEFPQDRLLDGLIGNGLLTAAHIDRLSAVVAKFHASLPAAGPDSRYGTFESVRDPVLQNFEQLRAMAADGDIADGVADLERWSEQALMGLRPVILARRERGFIRECHGDLHLGNMLLSDDQVHVFDGIEFNAELRWIDVVSEIAFLVMDLSERGRPDFGWRFLNDYLEITGDYQGVRLLAFYLVYRAVVRAKVARLRSRQQEVAETDRLAALSSSHAYLRYARSMIAERAGALIIMHGLSGSGKSHVARRLCEEIGAIRLRSDVERKRLHGLASLEPSDSTLAGGLYDSAATHRTYNHLARLARGMAEARLAVVVDAAHLLQWQRDLFSVLANECGIPFLIIACHAPDQVLRRRIQSRQQQGRDASEASLDVLQAQQASAEPFNAMEGDRVLHVDTTYDLLDEGIQAIRSRIAL
jgi:aminoglycoside phosphotransferase family enzyme/predicted kinase